MKENTDLSVSWIKESDEVYYVDGSSFALEQRDLEKLIALAKSNKRNRARLCLHANSASMLHEMIILHEKGTYVRPHKHMNKEESFYVLDGQANFLEFDETGLVVSRLAMGNLSSSNAFHRKISSNRYHSIVIKSDYLVFLEVTTGPFDPLDAAVAPWSPDPWDTTAVDQFLLQYG